MRAFGGGGRGAAREFSSGQIWRCRERQVKRAMSRMLLKRRLFSALTYHDLCVVRVLRTVSVRSEMLRALGEGGVMQES